MPTEAERRRACRGAIYLFHGMKFEGDPDPHSKYCVLMEGYDEAKRSLVVAFCTSRTDFHYRRTTVLIERGQVASLTEPTLIQLENWSDIPAKHFFLRGCRYVGQLPPDLLRQLDNALEQMQWLVDQATWLRMCG